MASAALSRRVEKIVRYSPLSEMSDLQRREFHKALLAADSFEDLRGEVAGGNPESGGTYGSSTPAGDDEHEPAELTEPGWGIASRAPDSSCASSSVPVALAGIG